MKNLHTEFKSELTREIRMAGRAGAESSHPRTLGLTASCLPSLSERLTGLLCWGEVGEADLHSEDLLWGVLPTRRNDLLLALYTRSVACLLPKLT